jgi:7,8-dihydropterin-6-yl-methyl-4-(beta-D-ribofuranosyl)aminobenzene 5'-phosphate synthase
MDTDCNSPIDAVNGRAIRWLAYNRCTIDGRRPLLRYRIIHTNAALTILILASLAAEPGLARMPIAAPAMAPTFGRTFDHVAIRYLSTQVSASQAGRAEWGFSALVEADDTRLLFDTGLGADTVTSNATALHIDLHGVHDIVLSHWHRDHVGGIRAVLAAQGATVDRPARIFVHPAIFEAKVLREAPGQQVNGLREAKGAIEQAGGAFDPSAAPREIVPGMVLTGGVPRADASDQKLPLDFLAADTRARDTVPDEQALVVNTRDGLIVLTGCGHAGVVNTVRYVRQLFPARPVYAVVGGFHWFASAEPDIARAGDQLKALGVSRLEGAHCTLVEPMFVLRQHGWSRETAAVGAIGMDFHQRPSASPPADDRFVASTRASTPMRLPHWGPRAVASARPPTVSDVPSCHVSP